MRSAFTYVQYLFDRLHGPAELKRIFLYLPGYSVRTSGSSCRLLFCATLIRIGPFIVYRDSAWRLQREACLFHEGTPLCNKAWHWRARRAKVSAVNIPSAFDDSEAILKGTTLIGAFASRLLHNWIGVDCSFLHGLVAKSSCKRYRLYWLIDLFCPLCNLSCVAIFTIRTRLCPWLELKWKDEVNKSLSRHNALTFLQDSKWFFYMNNDKDMSGHILACG